MDIQRCLEILEVDGRATPEEVKQAYKDLVSVWHPDRLSTNPRLRAKAENKIKEINVAYETLMARWSPEKQVDHSRERGPGDRERKQDIAGGDRVEAAAELGTRLFLHACSFLYRRARDVVQELTGGAKEQEMNKGKKEQE
jgi:DnaJ-class molecular chaperone